MCGICGIYNYGITKRVDKKILQLMCNTITHRGPDDEGYYINKNVGFGFRRLSIIDLKTGNQPIFNENKKLWIVCNGEIYNYIELRKRLIKKGHKFSTQGDVETILHLYEEYGINCIKYLNGMFAFALYDGRIETLYLIRDRMGIKPLLYYDNGKTVYFSSELRAFLVLPNFRKKIDWEAVSKYMTFEFIPAPFSIFKDVKKVEPAHFVSFSSKGKKIKKYWEISFKGFSDLTKVTEEELAEELRDILVKSIKRHIRSDVPVGLLLSGGMDSSSILSCLAEEIGLSMIQTFSIGFEEKTFDESGPARYIARYYNTQHIEFRARPNIILNHIPYIVDMLDEPLGDSAITVSSFLYKLTRHHVKVALSGDGGDEIFGGYPTYKAHLLAKDYEKIPKFLRNYIIEPILTKLPVSMKYFSFDFKVKRFISGMPYDPINRHFIWMGSFNDNEKSGLFRPEIYKLIEKSDTFDIVRYYLKSFNGVEHLDKILFLDEKLYLINNILRISDVAGMYHSLEIRVPYMDHTVVDFVTRLPWRLKVSRNKTKIILRKSMEGHLPEGIVKRGKIGLNIPVAQWFLKELKPFLLATLSRKKIERQGIFNYNYIKYILDEHFNFKKDNRKKLWTLLIFQLWYDKYVEAR